VAFIDETASGWQTAYVTSPVAVAANSTYTVSVGHQCVLRRRHQRSRQSHNKRPAQHRGGRQFATSCSRLGDCSVTAAPSDLAASLGNAQVSAISYNVERSTTSGYATIATGRQIDRLHRYQ
jgi:hypothetical protein